MPNVRTIAIGAGAAAVLAAAVYPLVSRRSGAVSAQSEEAVAPTVVQVARAESRVMERTVRLSGALRSGSEAALSPKQGGKIVSVLVREGQAVRRDQPLVRLDPSDARRQADQARAAAAAARATSEKAAAAVALKRLDVERRVADARRGLDQARLQLQKAQAGVSLQERTAPAEVERAQAGLDAARSELAKARRGARPEQRRQAEIQVEAADRAVGQAKKNLDDVQYLYDKGGAPRAQLDEAREGYQKARDGLEQAKAQLSLLQAGASPEEIAAAEAGVRNAEAALSAAKTAADRRDLNRVDVEAARGQVSMAQDALRTAEGSRAEIELSEKDAAAARAAYEQALAGWRLATEQVGETTISSPVDGVVSSLEGHEGEFAGPGRPIVTVVGTSGVYLEASAPARLVQVLRPGQSAAVIVDALPGRKFAGTVRSVGAAAGPDGRSFPVRIDLSAPAGLLKPGAFARADITTEPSAPAVTVPPEAVRAEGRDTWVWVVRQGRVAQVRVETPRQDKDRVMVSGDVRAGDLVVVSSPPGLQAGDAVQVQGAAALR